MDFPRNRFTFQVAFTVILALTLNAAMLPRLAAAQSTSPTPQESPAAAQAAPSGEEHKLTPEEMEQLEEAIIKASQNPVGNIAIVPFLNNFNYGYGPYQRLQYNVNIQPVVPIVLNKDWNLIARLIAPIYDNPSSAPPGVCASAYGCGSTFGIGDINPQFYVTATKPKAFIWGAGAQFLFPSGTPSTLSTGKYGIGPSLVGLIMPGHIVTGVLATQMWSIGGDPTKPAVSQFFIQPFFEYNLKSWAIFLGSSGITANWTATPEQGKWLVPVGTGVIKTFKLGDQPMQLGLFYYGNVVRPTYAPYGTIRFNWSLLFPIKRNRPALP